MQSADPVTLFPVGIPHFADHLAAVVPAAAVHVVVALLQMEFLVFVAAAGMGLVTPASVESLETHVGFAVVHMIPEILVVVYMGVGSPAVVAVVGMELECPVVAVVGPESAPQVDLEGMKLEGIEHVATETGGTAAVVVGLPLTACFGMSVAANYARVHAQPPTDVAEQVAGTAAAAALQIHLLVEYWPHAMEPNFESKPMEVGQEAKEGLKRLVDHIG